MFLSLPLLSIQVWGPQRFAWMREWAFLVVWMRENGEKIAWMRELKKLAWTWKSTFWLQECVNLPYFCVNTYVNLPFLPDFQIFPRFFRKFFPISQKNRVCVNFQKNFRECVNCEKELRECVNFAYPPLGGLKFLHNKLKSMYIIIIRL